MTITDLAGQLEKLLRENDVPDDCEVVFRLSSGLIYEVKRIYLEAWNEDVGELDLVVVELKESDL